MSKMAKTVSVVGFVVIMIAARYLYLLMSRDSESFLQESNYRLVLTIVAALITCIAGGLMFYFFLRQYKDKPSRKISAPLELATQSGIDLTNKAATSETFDIIAWEKLNPWLIGGQADDRIPMNGSASQGNGSPSVRRSTARRTHQRMYKKWSQARHDY